MSGQTMRVAVLEAVGKRSACGAPDRRPLGIVEEPACHWSQGYPDFTCPQCRAGRYNLCPRMRTSVRRRSTARSASTWSCTTSSPTRCRTVFSDDAAALVEPLSVGLQACRKARVGRGARVPDSVKVVVNPQR
jgi:threonine dehydrogenase-like Zn-dependent dehydrogenase